MTTRNREPDDFERALAAAARDALEAVPAGEHLDANTMAAWLDDSLEDDERKTAEAHVAACAQCQMVLAVIARTEPVAQPAQRPRWLRWAVPLTAAAAAAVLWAVVVPPRSEPQLADTTATEVDAVPRSDAPPPRTVQEPAAPQQEMKKEREQPRDELRRRENAPPPSTAGAGMRTDPRSVNESAAKTQAFDAAAPTAQAPPVIVSGDGAAHWRVVADPRGASMIQRSLDAGATWQTRHENVEATITAGVCPTASVCWFVGRAGIVLLFTGNEPARRLTFPATIDLTAVSAANDRTVTVATSDGRTFRSNDAGATWIPAPPQEKQPAPF